MTRVDQPLDRSNLPQSAPSHDALQTRTGIHIGEIEIRGKDVGGIAVHLAARIMAAAGAGEICVWNTVKDLVIGSEITFDNRGAHDLKGHRDPVAALLRCLGVNGRSQTTSLMDDPPGRT